MRFHPNRRAMLRSVLSIAASPYFLGGTASAIFAQFGMRSARATTASDEAFSAESVVSLAQTLAASEFQAADRLDNGFSDLSYDQYRDVRFRSEHAVWRGAAHNYELQFFPLGWLFKSPVSISLVRDGRQFALKADRELFSFGALADSVAEDAEIGFSGFRLHGPINRPDYLDEIAVFQGASYFRALGHGHVYGLSARGLAVDTAQAKGEEFPEFRKFWIEEPGSNERIVRVHALLDSPSVSGAYVFSIDPGNQRRGATLIDVIATLFPRRDVMHAGIAPLTSMFLHAPNDRAGFDDFRPAVHDSEALAVLNGQGECLWRPLSNPRDLQISAFVDQTPRGFGLMQRSRKLVNFQDLEARYDRRPSLWVEPQGDWGRGSVELVEIPSDEEIHDNIVAFWRPAAPLRAGQTYSFRYRLHWCDDVPVPWPACRTVATRSGRALRRSDDTTDDARQFSIDFSARQGMTDSSAFEASVTASEGEVSEPIIQYVAEHATVRVGFQFRPGSAAAADLRLALRTVDATPVEQWLYRWSQE